MGRIVGDSRRSQSEGVIEGEETPVVEKMDECTSDEDMRKKREEMITRSREWLQ